MSKEKNNNENKNINEEAQRPEEKKDPVEEGFLEVLDDGFGFLRADDYVPRDSDVFVSPTFIRRFNLRTGDKIKGYIVPAKPGEKSSRMKMIITVNGGSVWEAASRPNFDQLTPIYPTERLIMETDSDDLSTRIIDLIAPIGKGQRGLIVAPPKAGKTVLLKKIAHSIETNNKDVKLIVLLIDERPEEVTEMQRFLERGEVAYSTFDEEPENHIKVAENVLIEAKNYAAEGGDVVILLDSVTRLARAYNIVVPSSGKVLSGGFDPIAIHYPKKFFGAARNLEEAGSLTILATALIETGSRMDEVIFEEFKGTGNMEIVLDRKLSEKRIFPAIDISRSGTRREDLLLTKEEKNAVVAIRRTLGNSTTQEVTETIVDSLSKTKTNHEFVELINKKLVNR